MSVTGNVTRKVVVGGQHIAQASTPSTDAVIVQNESIPAAVAGELTTRTDADTGVVTIAASGHGVANGRVDVYWTGGARYGMTATVSVNDATIDGGAGDDLPIATTSVTICNPVEWDVAVLGTNVKMIGLGTAKRGQFAFCTAGPAEAWMQVVAEAGVYSWEYDTGITNPITGDSIVTVFASHGDTTAAIMKLAIMYDN